MLRVVFGLLLTTVVNTPLVFPQAEPLPLEDHRMQAWRQQVVEKVLPNGFKILVLKRGYAPVVTFLTYVDVGAVHDPMGQTGLAHLFEHMAFRGTSTIGTRDWEKERVALENMERAHQCYLREKWKGDQGDKDRMQTCWNEFKRWQQEAQKYAIPNEFGRIIERNGGRGLNATTSADATRYFYSLPSHRAELWFYLERARFKDPVFRGFYEERDVVLEEYRLRVENNPIGRLLNRLVGIAFVAHPYSRPVIGFPSDLENIDMQRAMAFYRTYYRAGAMVAAVVGNIDPAQVIRWAEKYFRDLPGGSPPSPIVTREPPQEGPRRFTLVLQAQPALIMAYRIPEFRHPDHWAIEALTYILGNGRSSRLYRRLVVEKKLAAIVGVGSGFPGNKYSNLFIIYAIPNPGVSTDRLEREILDVIATVQKEGITPAELKRFQAQALHDFYRIFESNWMLAARLTFYEKVAGSWQKLFEVPSQIRAVTPDDVRRVAATYCVSTRLTVGTIQTQPSEKSP